MPHDQRPDTHAVPDREQLRAASVLLAGAGNIGSPLANLLARAGVGRIVIVDRDWQVEARNLVNQDYEPHDVGRPKASVLARRLRDRFPGIAVEGHVADVEDLPLGRIDADVVLGALDSRRARQALISEIAWPRGIPVIDGGVGEGLVGRVQVFVPGPASACLECTWSGEDYRRLAAEYPCHPDLPAAAPPTAAPALTGATVAALMAGECLRLLAGPASPGSHEIAFDLWHRRFLPCRLRRSPSCRFDHEVVDRIIPLGEDLPTAQVGSLLTAIDRQFPDEAVHLECRRGLFAGALGPVRHVTPQWLREHASAPLGRFGFVADDRIRVRGPNGGAFVVGAGQRRSEIHGHA